jgi:hypothetical protein
VRRTRASSTAPRPHVLDCLPQMEVRSMAKTPKNHGKAWTGADNQQLRKLAKENTPTRVIGLKMGRSEDSIPSQASKIGQSLKPTNQRPYGTQGGKRKK